jgi:hypothetical protein
MTHSRFHSRRRYVLPKRRLTFNGLHGVISQKILIFNFRPWRWRRCVPPKRRLTLNGLHSVISQTILLFIFDPEDGGDMILRNIGWLPKDYTALYPRKYLHFSTLKVEAIWSSETSVDFQRTTRRYIPEDITLHFNTVLWTSQVTQFSDVCTFLARKVLFAGFQRFVSPDEWVSYIWHRGLLLLAADKHQCWGKYVEPRQASKRRRGYEVLLGNAECLSLLNHVRPAVSGSRNVTHWVTRQ